MSIWANKRRAVSVAPGDDNITLLLHGHKEPAYVLDNADELIPGHKAAEEWLQHFYNATKSTHIPFLIIARRPPALWHLGLRDIETRLKSCATIEIAQPDDALMRGLLLKLFADRQLMVEGGVVEYLAARLNRMGSAVIEAVAALDEAALETKRKISIPFAQRVLALKQEEE
jgi:chromosomal replication initiation ATPase DnaA